MNQGLIAVVVSIVTTAVAGLILVSRCISRFVVIRKAGADDLFAILAFLSSLAITCLVYVQFQHGLGKDMKEVRYVEIMKMFKYQYGSIILYGLGMTFIGISALLQYLRFLFQRRIRILCWTLIAIIASFGIAATFVSIFACQPIPFFWNKFIRGGKCINLLVFWYCGATYIIIMTIIVIAIPIAALKSLQLPRGQKMALIGVFALSGFTCLVSILRLHSIYVTVTSHNYTKDSAIGWYWASLELNTSIICVSVPPLKALFDAIVPRTKSSRDASEFSHLDASHRSNMTQSQHTRSTRSDSIVRRPEPDPWVIP